MTGKVLAWCLGVEIICLSSYILFKRIKHEASADAILVKSLHSADVLMGFYFCLLALVDSYLGRSFAINSSWWIKSDICQLLALLTFTSHLVSTIQETLVAVERLCKLVLVRKNMWPGKRGTLLITSGGWAVGICIPLAIVFGLGFQPSNRLCLVVNYNQSFGLWYYVASIVVTLDIFCLVVVLSCVINIHFKVSQSAREVKTISENKTKNNTAYIKKLLLISFVFFFSKMSTVCLILMPHFEVSITTELQMWVYSPSLAISAALNPILYAPGKSR
ncbi:hypothetical protein CAPTEDRAFT_90481 [Capitella teleta]|uniref:G-protein coupled receptors family 1 profile domain-containing protein n=1 Tax=Capitella teleta TaxID=283909 RepID=R7TAH7_CAPTE|nr:hypothetical protein CAPTEDRAFT_90481 [Capitella teleta]|eukprot:ELT90497.1 hypothetical protein CAPTEDRAFT_90481 [Capitella teleta]